MEQAEFKTERTRIISEMLDNPDGHGIYPTTKCFEELDNLFEQIRSEEQAKTRETAVEFACVSMIGTGKLEDSDIPTLHDEVSDFYDSGDWEFTNKAQHCSECGKPMEKKEIIIKGDIDTCDDCLCPE